MRHGYKGAFEMAATVDYLFAYDATTVWKTICTKESRRRTCSTHLCRRSFKKRTLFARYGGAVVAHKDGIRRWWMNCDRSFTAEAAIESK